MKKYYFRGIFLGLIIGIIGSFFVFRMIENKKLSGQSEISNPISRSMNEDKIESVTISNEKVLFNGREIELEQPLVTIKKSDDNKEQLYMPFNEILEYMHFMVDWDKNDKIVYLTMNNDNERSNIETDSDFSKSDIDEKAIEIIQKTGNWTYIESYLPYMSNSAIEKVVNIYNSKHIDSSEFKKASDYIYK